MFITPLFLTLLATAFVQCVCVNPYALVGKHYNITMIHAAGYVDMGYTGPNDSLLPSSEWQGMIVDMIEWVSSKAGFTYTLSSPMGQGPNCKHSEDPSATSSQYAVQYNCGSDDVTAGRTDMYWALYYITPGRLETNLMTVPFMSDVGVTLTATGKVPKSVVQEIRDKMAVLFSPFKPGVWGMTLALLVVVSLTFWVIEHGMINEDDRFTADSVASLTIRAQYDILQNEEFHVKPQSAIGYFTHTAFASTISEYIEKVLLSLTAHNCLDPKTARGKVVNCFFCFFCLIWMAAYVASLATQLAKEQHHNLFDSIERLQTLQYTEGVKEVCVKGSTVYASWLGKAYPDLKVLEGPGSYEELFNDLKSNKCSSLIDALPFSIYTTNSALYCDSGARIVGKPLSFGNVDMGVGLHAELQTERDVISYWIQQLRNCKSSMKSGACYNQLNMDDLLKKWAETGECEQEDGGGDLVLGVEVFLPFVGLLMVICLGAVIFEFMHDKKAKKAFQRHLSARGLCRSDNFKTSIVTYIKKMYPQCFDEQEEFDSDKWTAIWDDGKDIPSFVEEISTRLSHHYLRTDMVTWRLLRHTRKRLFNQSFVLSKIHHIADESMENTRISQRETENKKRAKRIKYTSTIVHNCLEIIEILTSRAVEEIIEEETEHRVRIDRYDTVNAMLREKEHFGCRRILGMFQDSKDEYVKKTVKKGGYFADRLRELNENDLIGKEDGGGGLRGAEVASSLQNTAPSSPERMAELGISPVKRVQLKPGIDRRRAKRKSAVELTMNKSSFNLIKSMQLKEAEIGVTLGAEGEGGSKEEEGARGNPIEDKKLKRTIESKKKEECVVS